MSRGNFRQENKVTLRGASYESMHSVLYYHLKERYPGADTVHFKYMAGVYPENLVAGQIGFILTRINN